MREQDFFEKYSLMKDLNERDTSFFESCKNDYKCLMDCVPSDLPFSNIWAARELSSGIPENSVMQYAILNSLRAWNFFEVANSINGFACTGGFG